MFGGGFFGGGGGGGGGAGGPGGFFGGGGFGGGRFDQQYQAFPVSFAGKEDLEKGNKIILPPSALDQMARLNITYPMLFEIANPATSIRTHGGVQEFIAEEGTCYLPYWIMCNLALSEGDLVRITNTSLPKGTFVKLQPLTSDFLDIHNPRAVLENTLRNFATLSVGDCIVINYNQKKFEIEIIETKPAQAISIIEADVNVDFAPPKDYKEPERVMPTAPSSGGGYRASAQEAEEPPAQPEKTELLFGGAGQRVDGKAIKASPALGPAPSPVIDESDEMPWIKRIPRGVKHTNAPYHFGGSGNMTSVPGVEKGKAAATKRDENAFQGEGQNLQ